MMIIKKTVQEIGCGTLATTTCNPSCLRLLFTLKNPAMVKTP
jgi:hypothetical protein